MKPAMIAAVILFAIGAAVVSLRPAPRTGPEPIRHGRDVCSRCRMHIAQPGFAGELRDKHGSLTRYDDIGCLVRALREAHTETAETWVEDHATHALVPLLTSALVVGREIRTPMGYGIVAFADHAAAQAFAASNKARIVQLEQLLREPDANIRHAHHEGSAAR